MYQYLRIIMLVSLSSLVLNKAHILVGLFWFKYESIALSVHTEYSTEEKTACYVIWNYHAESCGLLA